MESQPAALLKDVAHAAQVTFAFFADAAYEQDGRDIRDVGIAHGTGNRQHSDDA